MSCNNWQRGCIVIPSAAWAGFKASVRDAWNERQRNRHADALVLYEAIIKAAEGKRNVSWRIAADDACRALGRIPDVWSLVFEVFRSKSRSPDDGYRDPFSVKGSAGRPNRPTKAMFPEAGNRTVEFPLTHATISFDDATRTVTWDVPENNRAVERAHEEPVAIAFFKALSKIAWTASSGGEIHGNDEHNRDAGRDCAGAGGSYVTMRFGRAEVEWRKELASYARSTSRQAPRSSGGAFSPFGGRAWG